MEGVGEFDELSTNSPLPGWLEGLIIKKNNMEEGLLGLFLIMLGMFIGFAVGLEAVPNDIEQCIKWSQDASICKELSK